MCDRFSFVITADGKYYHNPTNSHTRIRDEFDIPEVGVDDQKSWELEDFPKTEGRAEVYINRYTRGILKMTPAAEKTARRVYQAIEDLFVKGDTSCFRKNGLFGDRPHYVDLIATAYIKLGAKKMGRYFTYGPKVKYANLYIGEVVRVKKSVETPRFGFGAADHNSIGVIVANDRSREVVVNFPEQSGWFGYTTDLEPVPKYVCASRPTPVK